MVRDYRPSCRTVPYAKAREGTVACDACGDLYAPSEARKHLEDDCGGAAWKKKEMLDRLK